MSKFSNFLSGSSGPNSGKGFGAGLTAATSVFSNMGNDDLTEEQMASKQGVHQALQSFGPIGGIISAAASGIDMIGGMTGLNLSNLDKDAAKEAGVSGSAGFNNFVNSLPGVSATIGWMGGKTKKSYKSDYVDSLQSAFSGSNRTIGNAQKLGSKRVLFGKGKMNRFITSANKANAKIATIGTSNDLNKQNQLGQAISNNNFAFYSGQNPQLVLSRHGMKFPELEKARTIINTWNISKSTEKENLDKFQLGGKMNLIPEGALHARKHNLDNVSPELEGQITTKGIPVIVHSEGGVTQTAEIEKDEWTLRKEFTDQLENLYKKYKEGSSDEIAIEAGKLICYELLKNTDDRSKLIKSIK